MCFSKHFLGRATAGVRIDMESVLSFIPKDALIEYYYIFIEFCKDLMLTRWRFCPDCQKTYLSYIQTTDWNYRTSAGDCTSMQWYEISSIGQSPVFHRKVSRRKVYVLERNSVVSI